MRIVAGKYRSRVLNEFEKIGVRPTSDKARESLFNIINLKVKDCVFLDLFAGTGAVGIEALSRGAKEVHFCDNSINSVKLIKSNLEKLKISEDIFVNFINATTFLSGTDKTFDIVYIDPPYASEEYLSAINLSLEKLKDGGVVIVESDKALDYKVKGEVFDERKYGKCHLTFIRKEK